MEISVEKQSLFFDFILISTPTWITEKELEREIKKKGDEKEGEEMHENFCSGGEQMRNGE